MRKVIIIASAIAVGFLIGFFFQPVISKDNIFFQLEKFDYVLNTAYKNYVEEVDSQQLVEAAIKGMLNELDPHSVYISVEEMKRVKEDFQGSFEGIGVEFSIMNDTITIIHAIPGGPSELLGIQSGDKIVKIDGKDAIGIEQDEVPKKLKGPKGTKVNVDIKRNGVVELIHFDITRDKIPLYSVDAKFMIEGTDVGLVQINRFSATTQREMMDALNELKKQGMKKLILDLRGNPGGFLTQAYFIADDFIPAGDTIVYTKGRSGRLDELYISKGGGEFEKLPVIVLIDAGSASASEIVSGAIQDLDRGLIVGTTSYGKGLVQRQYEETGDGSAFRITIAKYYTPSGRCIQRPYKDKDKYRMLAGRLNLVEGSYIENAYEKIKKQVDSLNNAKEEAGEKKEIINIDSLPLYKTKSGRTVFGAGGITPDYIVKYDTITKLSRDIRAKNIYFEYINDVLSLKSLKAKYQNDFKGFLKNYQVSDQMIADFRKLVESKDIKWDENDYKTDEEYIKISLKSTIARAIWDREKSTQVYMVLDKQVHKALELMPETLKLSRLK